MMKSHETINETEIQAVEALTELLNAVPALQIENIEQERSAGPDQRVDAIFNIRHGEESHKLIIEVKANGQPRFVRNAIYQLRNYAAHLKQVSFSDVTLVLISPYLSPESRSICDEHNVAYLDLYGNARIFFDGVYIEKAVADKPKSETRSLRSIFSPKASQILQIILREPQHNWRVAELAERADVSLGHVSNVRKALLEREWIEENDEGVALAKPSALLDAWRNNYKRPNGERVNGYTHLHGRELEKRLQATLNPYENDPLAIYSMHSAAQWIAPFVRNSTHTFYADEEGTERLQHALEMSPAQKGANVVIQIPKVQGMFRDAIRTRPGYILHQRCSDLSRFVDR